MFDLNVCGRVVNNFLLFLLMLIFCKFVKFEIVDGNIVNLLLFKLRICKLCSLNNVCGREKL